MLFDCGEGTQRQMMRYGVGFTLSDVFFTHFHADHFLGIVGLIRTFGLQGREAPLNLYGPRGAERVLNQAVALGVERSPFGIEIRELKPGDRISRKGYAIEAFATDHGGGAVGYALREEMRLGRFDPGKAREFGIPEGPLWGKLHKGEAVEFDLKRDDGNTERRRVEPGDLVGPPRPGRLVVITGDTRPSDTVVSVATGADLLVHEATFSNEESERAVETRHSTALEAAQVALAAGVRQLVLTHISARFSAASEVLLTEAQEVFPETAVARDGMVVDVAFPDSAQ